MQHVEVTIEGRPREVPSAIELTAYRVVQESLTNVIRHAGANQVRVALSHGADALVVAVTDDGGGSASSSTAGGDGCGIEGMRERVRAVGGTLEAGDVAGEGFRVLARLPLPRERA